jgi:C4-dicarboxylate transporter DctM subunit
MITTLLVSFGVLLLIGVPIAAAMALSSALAFLVNGSVPLLVVVQSIYSGMDSSLLLAVPLFILAGSLMEVGGITRRIVAFANALVGHLRGGIGQVTVIAEILFSEISGSTTADVTALGSVMTPALVRAKYGRGRAVAIVCASASMGILVPPSIAMLVLASISNLSVAALFMAGFLPAFTMALLIMILIYFQAKRENIPIQGNFSGTELWRSFVDALIALGMPAIIFGGILGGIFTATEAASVAVFYGLIVGVFIYREIKPRDLFGIFVNSALLTATVGFIVGAASIFAFVLASEQAPRVLGDAILTLSQNPAFFMAMSIALFLLIGIILEGLPAVIVLYPILQPIAAKLGIDPLHYAVVATATIGMGIFVPPLGIGFLIACGIGKISPSQAVRPLIPYLIVLGIGILVIAFVPWITLSVPRAMGLY